MMAQPHDMPFHPSSPPSEGGADSYKHDGTPDTRLTTFSPLEDSTKSSRLLSSLTLNGEVASHPVIFDGPSSIHHATSNDSLSSSNLEKDPFITTTPEKRNTKLSATASSFQPLLVTPTSPLVANGSHNLSTPRPPDQDLTSAAVSTSPTTGLPIYINGYLSTNFSSELKLSRSLRITCDAEQPSVNSICEFFKVSSASGRGKIAVTDSQLATPKPHRPSRALSRDLPLQ